MFEKILFGGIAGKVLKKGVELFEKNTEIGQDIQWNRENVEDAFGITTLKKKTKQLTSDIAEELGILASPKVGSIIFCELGGTIIDHVGIYVGKNKVIELTSEGVVSKLSLKEFLKGTYLRTGDRIKIMTTPLGEIISFSQGAERAKKMVGKHIGYNLLKQNCYTFIWGCISNDFNNNCVTPTDFFVKVGALESTVPVCRNIPYKKD